MKHEIYIFGSMTRGEVTSSSDSDVLVIQEYTEPHLFPPSWSVYSRKTIETYFAAGRLFAWHLHLEAVQVYPRTGPGFLKDLGEPAPYSSVAEDIAELRFLLENSILELQRNSPSPIYELGLAYTAIRDIAMAASWSMLAKPSFSRYAPYELPVRCPLPLTVYETAMRARHASTRGTAEPRDYDLAVRHLKATPILEWVESIWSQT
ncbi:nucleotidyltransferase domain-containing protein [Limnohabitans sp.]|jgi:hypothetical protein|uniref:nucleotidyltransferase domain-containing protein n=1 Tax=Limnohabitans sp. TaxID=1907725 RepID=UPI00345BF299